MQKYLGCAVLLVGCGQLPLPVPEPAPMPDPQAVAPMPPKRAAKPVPGEWTPDQGEAKPVPRKWSPDRDDGPMPETKGEIEGRERDKKRQEASAAEGNRRAEAEQKELDVTCAASYSARAQKYNADMADLLVYIKAIKGKEKQIEAVCVIRNDLHSVVDHVGGRAVIRAPNRSEELACSRPLPAGVSRDQAWVWLAAREESIKYLTDRDNETCAGADRRNGKEELESTGR